MMIHPDTISMLQESLPEYIRVAEWCVHFEKDALWGPGQAGGRLGFPAALILFSIVDAIGSFHRGNQDFTVLLDGHSASIRRQGFQHFYVLNSEYYGLGLSKAMIERLYANFRDLLVHNAALAPEHFLISLPDVAEAFLESHDGRLLVNINGFLGITESAVRLFLKQLPTIVPGSEQESNINKKG